MHKTKVVTEIPIALLPEADRIEVYFRVGYRRHLPYGVYNHVAVQAALLRLKTTDPQLYRTLEYLWMCPDMSRNQMAAGREMDSNTLLRAWYRAFNIILNYLAHPELTPVLRKVNLIAYD